MENILMLLINIALVIGYVMIGFIAFMMIQLISYRVFKFNLYKKLVKVLYR